MTSFSLKIIGLMIVLFGGANAFAEGVCQNANAKTKDLLTELQSRCNFAIGMKNSIDENYVNRRIDESGTHQAINTGAGTMVGAAGSAAQTAFGAFNSCMAAYESFNKKIVDLMNEVNQEADKDSKNAQACEKAKKEVKEAATAGYAIAKKEGKQLLSAMSAAERAQAEATLTKIASDGGADADEGFTWKDAGKWGAIAGIAGVGAMALLGSGSGSGNNKPNQTYTGSTNGGTGGTGGTTETPVDCTNLSAAVASATCDNQTIVTCNTVSKINTTECQAFSDRYCGLSGGTNPPGLGSSYCRSASAYKFCATTGRSSCASCVQVAQWASPACATNPSTSCAAQFSPAQLSALQATPACGSDPIYADSSVFQPANPLLPAPVLPSSLGTNSVARSVASQSVGAAYGAGLFYANSATLKELCQNNALVDCHAK